MSTLHGSVSNERALCAQILISMSMRSIFDYVLLIDSGREFGSSTDYRKTVAENDLQSSELATLECRATSQRLPGAVALTYLTCERERGRRAGGEGGQDEGVLDESLACGNRARARARARTREKQTRARTGTQTHTHTIHTRANSHHTNHGGNALVTKGQEQDVTVSN